MRTSRLSVLSSKVAIPLRPAVAGLVYGAARCLHVYRHAVAEPSADVSSASKSGPVNCQHEPTRIAPCLEFDRHGHACLLTSCGPSLMSCLTLTNRRSARFLPDSTKKLTISPSVSLMETTRACGRGLRCDIRKRPSARPKTVIGVSSSGRFANSTETRAVSINAGGSYGTGPGQVQPLALTSSALSGS
jgi:hypothetical protein